MSELYRFKQLEWSEGMYPPAWDYEAYSAGGVRVTYIVRARRTGRNEPGDWAGGAEVVGCTGYDRYARMEHYGKCTSIAEGKEIAEKLYCAELSAFAGRHLEVAEISDYMPFAG